MKPSRRRRLVAACLVALAMGVAGTSADAADVSTIVAKVCYGRPGAEITRGRLASAVLSEVGIIDEDLLQDPAIRNAGSPGDRAVLALSRRDVQGAPGSATLELPILVVLLEEALASSTIQSPAKVGLSVDDAPRGRNWLFDPARQWTIHCAKGKGTAEPDSQTTRITQYEAGTKRAILSVRKTVAELGLTGDEAKKAGAAQIGFKRERVPQDDGTTKTSSTLTFDGTVGLRVTKPTAAAPVYAYANYTLSRARKSPPPVLAPGKTQGDDDTDALELGAAVAGRLVKSGPDFSLVAAAQAGYVVDYVGGSRRLRLRGGITPGLPWSIGRLCDLGGFNESDAVGLRFRSRCTLQVEVEASHVFKAGTTAFYNHGEFLAAGATLGYDLAAPLAKDSAVLGSVRYRVLPTIWGRAPNVERLDATIKYRFYAVSDLGFDLGLTYGKGTEPKSLKEEDKLELGFGVVF